MTDYVYQGPGPVVTPEGEIVHPNDVRGFTEDPGAPWRLLSEALADGPAPVVNMPAGQPVSVPLKTAVAGIEPVKPERM